MRFVLYCPDEVPHSIRELGWLAYGIYKASQSTCPVLVTNVLSDKVDCADIALGIDRARPEYLPARVRHISWVQDLINWPTDAAVPLREHYEARAAADDIIYTLGDGRSVGVDETDPHWRGSLTAGVDETLFARPYRAPELDLSFVGYIPNPIETWQYWGDRTTSFLLEAIAARYRPLHGELDPLGMFQHLRRFLVNEITTQTAQDLKWLIIEYARWLDRSTIARLMLATSKACELRGANWHKYPEFQAWAKPHSNEPKTLHDTYQRSRVNLQVNITGFGIHTRVLECMALGCFVMSHTTVRDCVGQLTECFEPGVHYGAFTPETFTDVARYWLDNREARIKVIGEARKLVRAKHLWEHRGGQILRDLVQ